MEHLFTIGEMARLFQTNIRTLRYYDKIGLLKPEQVDPQTGYRYYSTRQFERMNTIKYLRTLHVPLEKIAAFFADKDIDSILQLLQEQQKETQQQITLLQQIYKKIEGRIKQLTEAQKAPLETVVERYYTQRPVIMLEKEIARSNDLEYPIRELERNYDLEHLIFLGKVGVSVSIKALRNGSCADFSSVFLLLEDGDAFPCGFQNLAEGWYLTLCFCGTHQEAWPYYQILLDYMNKHQQRPLGDALEITVIDEGLTDDPKKFMTQLQIPVQRS